MKYGIAINALTLALLALGGCSLLPYGPQVESLIDQAREQGTIDRKKSNDDKASLLLDLACDASIGAVFRITDDRKQALLIELCGGPAVGSPMTVDDLAALMLALQGKALVQAQP